MGTERTNAERIVAVQNGRTKPDVVFYRFVPGCRAPQRADRAAAGLLPTRAFRYCEAVVSASAFGWYMFPPTNFSVLWDGSEVIWTYEGADSWFPLSAAQFPGFREQFDEAAPEDIKEFSPPFLGALKEPGVIQVWTGLCARTAPGWSLLIRPPANLPRSKNFEHYEGIIETDRWFGPIFTNLRLTRTHVPVELRTDFPFLQVQPLPRDVYSAEMLDCYSIVPSLGELQPEDWDAFYRTVVKPSSDPDRPRGEYAVNARKRRRREPAAEPFPS